MSTSTTNCARVGSGLRWLGVAMLAIASCPAAAAGAIGRADGFTEPYRSIAVAAAETGILVKLDVAEGDHAQAGQPLGHLDLDVHQALLAIARESCQAQGRIQSAEAELALRLSRRQKLEALRLQGHARQEEVDRALADVAIARANLLAAQEEQAIRKLEYEKIKVQLERRTLRAPIDGVVTRIHKEPGEFVAPNDPSVLTLVQLNPLLAVFSVHAQKAARFEPGQSVMVYFAGRAEAAAGMVELVSPVTDAESGTIRIKVKIDNPSGRFRSGERCWLRFDEDL